MQSINPLKYYILFETEPMLKFNLVSKISALDNCCGPWFGDGAQN